LLIWNENDMKLNQAIGRGDFKRYSKNETQFLQEEGFILIHSEC